MTSETNQVIHTFENPDHVLWYVVSNTTGQPDRTLINYYYYGKYIGK